MNTNNIKGEVTFIEQKYWGEIEELAQRFRRDKVLPICARRGWTFLSGNGNWFFIKKDGSNVESVRDTKDPEVHQAIEAMAEELVNRRSFGESVESVFEKDVEEFKKETTK